MERPPRTFCAHCASEPTPNPSQEGSSTKRPVSLLLYLLSSILCSPAAPAFLPPTANRALFEPGGEERYFVGTVGKPWTSGTFGCVRTEGWQMHEGLDIRCLQRDTRGEPIDPVLATADGTVAYINRRTALSNYGNYLILRHVIDGLEIYSLYAHLREVRAGLQIDQAVKAGEQIAVMGRTTNAREGISRERAHLHFELDLLVNEDFPRWYKKAFPSQRNDHGVWNGQNLLGLDPRAILLAQHHAGERFNLLNFVRQQTELCRVLVRDNTLRWATRYPALLRANPGAAREGIAGYELVLNFTGVPFELTPRTASEIKFSGKYQLLSVNEAEQRKNPCRRLVTQRAGRWILANNGQHLLDLLTF